MTDLRPAMERATEAFTPTSDWLEGVRVRVRRRARARKLLAGSVALITFAAAFGILIIAVRPGARGGATAVQPCPRTWEEAAPSAPGAYAAVEGITPDDAWAVGPILEFRPGARTRIQHWNGEAWTTVASPNPVDGPGAVNQLVAVTAISSDDVWAVGESAASLPLSAASPGRALTAHWDGSVWTAVPSPDLGGTETRLNDVDAVASDDVWAVGLHAETTSGRGLVEHWDGSTWSVVPVPDLERSAAGSTLDAVEAIGRDDVWVFGDADADFFAAHWDGNGWTRIQIADQDGDYGSFVAASSMGPDNLWVLGNVVHDQGDDPSRTIVAHFDGASWSVTDLPSSPLGYGSLSGLAVVGRNDVWTSGWMGENNLLPEGYGSMRPWLVHWDGEDWTVVDDAVADGQGVLDGIGSAGGDIWLVGHRGGGYDQRDGFLDGEDAIVVRGSCAS